ncbi:MAG TPA: hypothetical protein VID48_15620 [Solirubrobacteraceae bacterium]
MLSPATAGAITFGTDLSKPANTPGFTCSQGVYNQFLGQFLYGPFGGNCMWSSIPLGSTEALEPSIGGTVTAVRVKAGAVGGQMQVDVIRFLTSNGVNPGTPNLACCFVETYGPIFSAAANTTTTVQTNLHMTEDPFPPPGDLTTIATNDVLALSVLEPNAQIPLYATNSGANDLNVLSYAWYPAPTAPTVPAPSPNPISGFADMSGFQVLMNADLTPDGGAPGAGGGTPGGGGAAKPAIPILQQLPPALTFPKLALPVANGKVALPLQCANANCVGNVLFQNLGQPGATIAKAKKRKPKTITYGSAPVSVTAGAKATVIVKLNANGKKATKAHRKLSAWANFTFGSVKLSKRVTLTH